MNIVRRYKIHLINKECLTEKELEDLNIIFNHVKYSKENYELIEFIYNNILNLKQVKIVKYSGYLFYFKDNKCIFQQDLNYNDFYVNDELIWTVFDNEFNYKHSEIKTLIKGIVEQAYKLSEIT